MNERRPWRQILKEYNTSFLNWLELNESEHRSLDLIANKLEEFLIDRINYAHDAREFWDIVPCVRSACNNPCTYKLPWSADAYAFSHFLMRYSRTWAVLKHLTAEACLPLGDQGVRVLDIGTGPAPVLYAIEDFYNALNDFAQESNVQELRIPPPQLDCIENSQIMTRFIHHFSEYCGRHGPFGATIDSLESLDFPSARNDYFERNRYEQFFDEEFDNTWLASIESNSIFRYRLIVFSNFFTLASTVKKFKKELQVLFSDMNPGSTVVILGSRGKKYRKIYRKLSKLAHNAYLRHDQWNADHLGNHISRHTLNRIRRVQNAVYLHLESLASYPPLPQFDELPDYTNLDSPNRIQRNFAVQVFRRGKWPS